VLFSLLAKILLFSEFFLVSIDLFLTFYKVLTIIEGGYTKVNKGKLCKIFPYKY
jgi:hypothetical protein